MGFIELLLIGVGLSMDAFAVAICKGIGMRKLELGKAAVIALFFGGFQFLMPLVGYLLGTRFEQYITSFDHWIAFALLAFIGGKMAIGSFKQDCDCEASGDFRIGELFMLAIATSIDALAVGITFAFLGVSILPASLLIGVTTFCISIGGVAVGHFFGTKYKSKAELVGGLILVAIGIKILVEHLFFA